MWSPPRGVIDVPDYDSTTASRYNGERDQSATTRRRHVVQGPRRRGQLALVLPFDGEQPARAREGPVEAGEMSYDPAQRSTRELLADKLPHVPTEHEIRSFYDAVWKARRGQDVVMIKTLLYTRVRVSELVSIRIRDVDLDRCRIRIEQGKGKKDRYVPFPASFKETLALHIHAQKQAGASHLFESSWKKPYSDRGVRKILARYATAAGIQGPISPHRLRHFLLTWLKTQDIDDALIQPYSGHATRQSLEIYSRIALADAQQSYDQAIGRYPV